MCCVDVWLQTMNEGFYSCLDVWSEFIDHLHNEMESRASDKQSCLTQYVYRSVAVAAISFTVFYA